ncbi:hypothetical protein M0R04_15995 [Candidatus Dojkabacteria bacterium]|nr:hypothetical protein [Candidatus Dojkabacteria bacterium]
MKNLLIYINPSKKFGDENKVLAKIQIDNSLDLGWTREDIVLITNFEYEYNDVKAIVMNEVKFCDHCPQASKINTIVNMFKLDIIKPNKLWWLHDFDAFQLEPITEEELEISTVDMALTDYGRLPRWNTGLVFFRHSARDIMEMIQDLVYKSVTDEERALNVITRDIPAINSRIKKLNITYNLAIRNIKSTYKMATKPLKVIHFHPIWPDKQLLDVFMYGKNKINTVLMNERLIKIFKDHGIE